MPILVGQRLAAVVLLASTIVFAINIFDVFSLYYLIAQELNQNVASLGLISATMTIGIGLFQIPGGILAARYRPKLAAMLGMAVIGIASVLMMLSTNIYQIAILRFILGGGLALYFPSAIVLIAQHFRRGSEAFSVGAITGSNAAGGIIGLIIWAILSGVIGWRLSIMIGGLLAGIAAIAIYFVLPSKTRSSATQSEDATVSSNRFSVKSKDIISILTDKEIILLGILLLGSQATLEQTLGFMPFYLQSSLHVDPALAGIISSLTLISSLIGAPITGLIYDRHNTSFVKIVIILGSMLAAGASINFFPSLETAIISTILVGYSGGGLFALFSNAARAKISASKQKHPRAFATLAVNWVHAIALTGTFWAPLLFAFSATNQGYSSSWPLIGSISFVLIVLFAIIGSRMRVFSALAILSK